MMGTGRIGLQYPRVVNATPHSVLLPTTEYPYQACVVPFVIHGFI